MWKSRISILLLPCLLLTGCTGTASAPDPNTVYVFDDVPTQGETTVTASTLTFQAVPQDSVIPASIGDDVSYPKGYNGIYIETLDDNLINYASYNPMCPSMTAEDIYIINMDDNTAWSYITNGKITEYPSMPYAQIKGTVKEIANENTTNITVNVWYWEDPNDDSNMNKVTVQKTFTVNKNVASLFTHIFADIYADPSQPVINIADSAMGTWVLRGKMHSDYNTVSAHAFGTAIDINPSSGSYNIAGTWYGNGYGQQVMTRDIWEQLPECHQKYHVLYDESPIVKIFKAYGFYWGGDWVDTKDNMHFAYIGDSPGRNAGIANYRNWEGIISE